MHAQRIWQYLCKDSAQQCLAHMHAAYDKPMGRTTKGHTTTRGKLRTCLALSILRAVAAMDHVAACLHRQVTPDGARLSL